MKSREHRTPGSAPAPSQPWRSSAKPTRKLLVVNGLFSFIHALSAAPTGENEDLWVLVLFQYDPANDAEITRKIQAVRLKSKVKILHDPSTYIAKLGDKKFMHDFCPDATEIRMFFTHNYWLHNAVFSSYPQADILFFEEGTASFYPGLLERFSARNRVRSISVTSYLDRFKPQVCKLHPELVSSPPAALLRTLIGALPKPGEVIQAPSVPSVILVEQYFHKKGKQIAIDEIVDLYVSAAKRILSKGYNILYKSHPREEFGISEQVLGRLDHENRNRVSILPRSIDVLESVLLQLKPEAIVGVNSTSQLTAPHFYDVPSFRIETDIPLRMCRDIPIERRGLVCNHFAFLSLIPALSALPAVGSTLSPRQVFFNHLSDRPSTIDDPLIAGIAESDFGNGYVEIIEKILDPEITVCSFDVFDNLVWRPTTHSSDIFPLLDRRFRDELGNFLRYSTLRSGLIEALRQHDRHRGTEKEEYSLDEIYRFAGKAFHLPDHLIDSMKAAEEELERSILRPRRPAVSLLLIAMRAGKTVTLTSDTYFPESDLRRIIAPSLPYVPEIVLSSATAGVTKRTGALFDVLIQRTGAEPEQVLHIGDNGHSDIKVPEEKGLKVAHFPNPWDCFRKKDTRLAKAWDGVRMETGTRLVLGLFAGRYFENPFRPSDPEALLNGDAYWLGYAAVGPALLSWMQWTLQEAEDLGIDRLLFIARDGFVPLQIAHLLQQYTETGRGVELRYTYASRKAYMPVYQNTPAEISFTRFAHGLDPRNSVERSLLNRFGEDAVTRFGGHFAAHGFDDLKAPITRERMGLFNDILASISGDLAKFRHQANQRAKAYLTSQVDGSKHPAIVDIGYSGSSQRAFILASKRRVDGFYLVTMEHNVEYSNTLDYRARDFTGEFQFFKNGAFLEYLITPHGLRECIGYEDSSTGAAQPHFGNEKPFDPIVDLVHTGIQRFLADIENIFADNIGMLKQRAVNGCRMLQSFIAEPSRQDVTLFDNLMHEDEIGAARPRLLDYWAQGKAAVNAK